MKKMSMSGPLGGGDFFDSHCTASLYIKWTTYMYTYSSWSKYRNWHGFLSFTRFL